ncbi:hypothetical protein HYDPIDRAFT_37917 [Hydnomerulius pinastri MD-312]|nr:hypothetical protein HYDPIDRAFT_37917 [Hydnomerulius pinastri MD-312]
MSLSDVSDLTDLSSDEEEVPLAKTTTKATKKGPKEYKITNVLRAPRTTQYTTKSLYDQIIDNAIDLDPEYQRAVVWNEEKQSGVIDSILRNYYIPPIIFAVSFQEDGSELRTCIDGKQRLTSIQRFIDGQIPHKDSFTNEKLWFKATATSTRRKLLPQYLRTQFANKQIVCVEYTDLNADQEREIFQRVQLGVALTPAERLQAIVGPWSTVIREIQSQVLGEEGFEGYLDWGHARGRDFQCLATIGYLIENHPKTSIPGTKTLEKWLQKSETVSPKLRGELHETFRIFLTLARDKKYSGSLNRPTRVSPIEFVMIGVLIYVKRSTLSLTQISSAIEKMRKDVRASHKDIRSNTRVTKHLLEFMNKRLQVSELKSDGQGDKPASVVTKAIQPVKRKRPLVSDSDDSEEEELPRKAKVTKSATTTTTNAAASGSKTSKQTFASSGPKKTAASSSPAASIPAALTSTKVTTTLATTSSKTATPAPVRIKKCSPTPAAPPPNQQSAVPKKPSPLATPNPPTPLVTSSSQVVPSGPFASTAMSSAKASPLTVQTTSTVKSESPPIGSLDSTSVLDRLAPIRAAKASLLSGTNPVQSPVSGSEFRARLSPGVNIHQPSIDPRQAPSATQPATLQQRQRSSVAPMSQPFPISLPPGTPGQTPPISTTQVEDLLRAHGLLQNLQAQFSNLGVPVQNQVAGAVNGALTGPNVHPMGIPGNPSLHASVVTGLVNSGFNPTSSQIPCGNGVLQHNQGIHPGGTQYQQQTQPQANLHQPNQIHGPHPSSAHSIPPKPPAANGTVHHGSHSLPQRPVAPIGPVNTSTRAEPLGPPPKSASSTGSLIDDRRGGGSFPSDRHDRDWDRDRDMHRRDSSHARDPRRDPSWNRDRHRDGGWGSRGRGGRG